MPSSTGPAVGPDETEEAPMQLPHVRRLGTMLAVLAAVTLAAAWTGQADATQVAKFRLTVKGVQTVTWDEPRHAPYFLGDGYHRYWTSGRGEERITFRTKPARVYAARIGGRAQFTPIADPRTPVDEISDELDGTATLTRTSIRADGSEPGPLGGGSSSSEVEGEDCGTRKEWWDVTVYAPIRNRLAVRADSSVIPYPAGDQPTFADCLIMAPKNVQTSMLNEIRADLPTSEVFDSGLGRIIVIGRKSWKEEEVVPSDGTRTRKASVYWAVQLDRIGGGPRR